MQLNITNEDVEKLVKEQLIKSSIGEFINKGIQESLMGYNSPIEASLKKYVTEIAEKLIREKYSEEIREIVVEHMSKVFTKEMMQKTVDASMDRIVRALNDRY